MKPQELITETSALTREEEQAEVIRRLEEDIIFGRFAPGSRLVEDSLMGRYGASRPDRRQPVKADRGIEIAALPDTKWYIAFQ